MAIRGFGGFDPAAYQTNNQQNRSGAAGEVAGRNSEGDGNRATTSSIASNARATFERISTLVSDPRTAIRRYLVLRQLNTRMRNPETPVRSFEDARSRFLQQDPREMADTVEILREAAENGALDEGTFHWMGQAAMALIQRQSPSQMPVDLPQIVGAPGGAQVLEALGRVMEALRARGFPIPEIHRIGTSPLTVHH